MATSEQSHRNDNKQDPDPASPGNQSQDGSQAKPADRERRASSRGFASMDPKRQREIASEGGKAAHEKGTAHQFSSQEAREAGRKGGQAAHVKGTAHEFNSEEARIAGRKGGLASHSGQQRGNKDSSGKA